MKLRELLKVVASVRIEIVVPDNGTYDVWHIDYGMALTDIRHYGWLHYVPTKVDLPTTLLDRKVKYTDVNSATDEYQIMLK